MSKLIYNREASSNPLFRVYLQDVRAVDGSGLTGLDSTSSGLRIDVIRELETTVTSYTVAGSTIETITTIGTYAAPTATKCRFKVVDGTNMPGLYEIHLAQALTGTGDASRNLIVMIRGAANLIPCVSEVQLTVADLEVAIPTADQNADALLDRTSGIETSWTLRQALRIILSSVGAKLSGAATTTVTIRDVGDVKNRIVATVDADGNRSALTLDNT